MNIGLFLTPYIKIIRKQIINKTSELNYKTFRTENHNELGFSEDFFKCLMKI